MAAFTAATTVVSRGRRTSLARAAHPWAKELTLILVLYSMWQYAGRWSIGRAGAAVDRGRRIWQLERSLHVPSERSLQQVILGHRGVAHWLNAFYAEAHVPALGVLLVWLFVRHRDSYPLVRTAVALVTCASLLIQLVPVAPPRLVPHLGMIDIGAVIGPSDYAGGAPGIDQLSAMPSLHIGWALVVAGGIVHASRTQLRWLVVAYPALTVFAVVATGNHYWADGAAAAVLCALAAAVVALAYRPPADRSASQNLVRIVEHHRAGDEVVQAAMVAAATEQHERDDVGDDAEHGVHEPADHLPQGHPAPSRNLPVLRPVAAHTENL